MAVKEPVMESAFSFRLRQSLFLIKFHGYTITNGEGVCDGVCFFAFTFWRSLILIKLQALILNGTERSCDEISEGACF